MIQSHLEANGSSVVKVNNLMNPTDKQDVPSALNLMKEIWALPHPSPTDSPISCEVWRHLNIFLKLLQYFTLPYIDVHMGLYEQLQSLSAMAHLAALLYTHGNTRNAFIQSQLYWDIQIAVKNAYFCVAKTEQDNPSGKFFIYQLGSDRLEWIFGWIWSQSGSNVNMDVYSLSIRTSGAVECNGILAEKPEWD